jgi:hypothetical protein
MNDLERKISELLKFFKPQVEGNISIESFEGFHHDLWMEKKFKLKFKAHRDLKKLQFYLINPSEKSGNLEIILNGIKPENVHYITSSEKKIILEEEININNITINSTICSSASGDIRNLVLLLEKLVFY